MDGVGASITISRVREFLSTLGWRTLKEGAAHRLYVFEHDRFPMRRLVLPLDDGAPDKTEAIEVVFRTLAHIMGCPLALLAEMATGQRSKGPAKDLPEPENLRRVSWLTDMLNLPSDNNTYKMIQSGSIPSNCVVKFGRNIRIKPDAVKEWLKL